MRSVRVKVRLSIRYGLLRCVDGGGSFARYNRVVYRCGLLCGHGGGWVGGRGDHANAMQIRLEPISKHARVRKKKINRINIFPCFNRKPRVRVRGGGGRARGLITTTKREFHVTADVPSKTDRNSANENNKSAVLRRIVLKGVYKRSRDNR